MQNIIHWHFSLCKLSEARSEKLILDVTDSYHPMDECSRTRKVRHGLADHHILHYLPQTQSHLFPKGQFDYAGAITRELARHARRGHGVTSPAEKKKKIYLCSCAEWEKNRKKMHLKRSLFCFCGEVTPARLLITMMGKVIDRPSTLRGSNFTGNLQGLLGQSYTLIPEGKHHYGLSFISAVLGQFKPTQRTHFFFFGGGSHRR